MKRTPVLAIIVPLVCAGLYAGTMAMRLAERKQFKAAIQHGNLDLVSDLLKRHPNLIGVDLGERRGDRLYPLNLAAGLGQVEICRLLITNGAAIDEKDKFGLTALHRAVKHHQTNLALYLLDSGANPDTQDIHGNSLIDSVTDGTIRDALLKRSNTQSKQ